MKPWVQGVVGGIGGSIVVVTGYTALAHWPVDDLPAWVQAVGSVGAIAAGFGVAAWQRHDIERTRRRELLEQSQSIDISAAAIRALFEQMKATLANGDSATIDVTTFVKLLPRYRRIMSHHLDRPIASPQQLARVVDTLSVIEETTPAIVRFHEQKSGGTWAAAGTAVDEGRNTLQRLPTALT